MPRTLSDLSPTDLENLAFDILQSAGMGNLVWRTPGADGGRDIEGTYNAIDLSGHSVRQKWYVECKRYSASLDWPTVWGKVAYSDNLGAHFLLIITTSTPSPACETQISLWNSNHRYPQIRVWRGYELAHVLQGYAAVAAKYGLTDSPNLPDAQFITISNAVMKISQANYAAAEFGFDPLSGLEAAAAISELASLRMEQVRRLGQISPAVAARSVPDYPWLTWHGDLGLWEDAGIRALLSSYRYYLGASAVRVDVEASSARVSADGKKLSMTDTTMSSLRDIALWADVEIFLLDQTTGEISIRSRLIP